MNELSEIARKLKNEYQNQWKKKNPDKVKAAIARYWERKAKSIPIEQRAKSMYQTGMTQREIAARLNISLGAVNKYLKQP